MSPFDRWYVDLSLIVFLTGLAVLTVTFGQSGIVRAAVIVPLVTVLPGYAFVALLYPAAGNHAVRTFDENERGLQNPLPTKDGVDALERFVFAVIATLAIVPAVALVVNFTPWRITVKPLLFGTAGITLLFTAGGLIRRFRLPAERRYTLQLSQLLTNVTFSPSGTGIGGGDSRVQYFNVALGVVVVLLLSSIGYAAVNPPQGGGFTEFYVDTENVSGDTRSMYPSQFEAGETRPLTVNVTNQEHEQIRYEAVAVLQRVDDTGNEPVVTEEDRMGQRTVTLGHDQSRAMEFEITPSMRGSDLRLVFLLYRGGAPSDPAIDSAYRTLRLPISVSGDADVSRTMTAQQLGNTAETSGPNPLATASAAPGGV